MEAIRKDTLGRVRYRCGVGELIFDSKETLAAMWLYGPQEAVNGVRANLVKNRKGDGVYSLSDISVTAPLNERIAVNPQKSLRVFSVEGWTVLLRDEFGHEHHGFLVGGSEAVPPPYWFRALSRLDTPVLAHNPEWQKWLWAEALDSEYVKRMRSLEIPAWEMVWKARWDDLIKRGLKNGNLTI